MSWPACLCCCCCCLLSLWAVVIPLCIVWATRNPECYYAWFESPDAGSGDPWSGESWSGSFPGSGDASSGTEESCTLFFWSYFWDFEEDQFQLWFQWFCFIFSIVGIPSGMVLTRLCVWMRKRKTRAVQELDGVLVFLSYRVSSDAAIVERLYNQLSALGVEVWRDAECLEPGLKWERDFVDALCRSNVFVPVLSRAGLANFALLKPDSVCDNVLLEYRLARELQERGRIARIVPVLVGDFFNKGGDEYGVPSCGGVPIASVEAKVAEHLARKDLGMSRLAADLCGPKPVLDAILAHQGTSFSGRSMALATRSVACFIAECARLVGSGEDGMPTRWMSMLTVAMRDIFPHTHDLVRDIRRKCYCMLGGGGTANARLLAKDAPEDPGIGRILFSTGVTVPGEREDDGLTVNPVLLRDAPALGGSSALRKLFNARNSSADSSSGVQLERLSRHMSLAKSAKTKGGDTHAEATIANLVASREQQADEQRDRLSMRAQAVHMARRSSRFATASGSLDEV